MPSMVTTIEAKQWIALIVDDEPDNLSVAEKVLSFRGAQVYTARNGQEGLRVLERITPTFVLLDLSMPKMDGWEMHRQVRENPLTMHVPVIALTAHAMEGDRDRVMQAGFDGYIAKPFRIMTLFADIQACLDRILKSRGAQVQEASPEKTP